MENTQKALERENPSLQTSPKSNNICITTNNNDVESPSTPKHIPKSETNGFPTTFIHADTNSFKQVVQMLTGSPETATKQASKPGGPVKTRPKKPGFKLHERRNSTLKNLKIITGLSPTGHTKILSPSFLDLQKLDIRDRSSSPSSCNFLSLEEKLVAERGFYLLGSPVTTPQGSEPQLLPLFPLTSPRVSGTS
ncbi:VQ motif-containing protein 4-like [Rhododendron vialii]|uniref:VQ motif-containing protein 4-like n=1 Tax=Rhododendron vialii TaxID=182163 RepID=UPI00265FF81C|nr:VQ motif-containing protein 4-like [Rhododendron vialii]